MGIADPALGITLVVLGVLVAVVGIAMAMVIPGQLKKLKEFLSPLLEMLGGLPNPLVPMLLGFVNMALTKICSIGNLIGLGGGALLVVVGVIVVVLGIQIWF